MEAYYDLSVSPCTHDFINWLSRVEEKRIREKQPDLQIRFVPGIRNRSDRDTFYSVEKRMWRLQNLLMPSAWLLPSVTDVSIKLGRQTQPYLNPGGPRPAILKAQDHALEIVREWLPDNAVTITLRDSEFEPMRNSNTDEWTKIAVWLRQRGYSPVIVPDSEADMEGRYLDIPFKHYRAACYMPDLRQALYELAVMNCVTNSGIMLLMLYGHCRMMACKMVVDGVKCCGADFLKRSGFSSHHNWGAGKSMHEVEDTADNVIPILEAVL